MNAGCRTAPVATASPAAAVTSVNTPRVVPIEAQHRLRGAGREAEEQVGIAVGVEVAPRRRARGPRVGDAGGRRDVGEACRASLR